MVLNPSDDQSETYLQAERLADRHLPGALDAVSGGFDLYIYKGGALRAFRLSKGKVWCAVKLRIGDQGDVTGELCAYMVGGVPRALKQKHRARPEVLSDAALDRGQISKPILRFRIGDSLVVHQ